jgi:hypothetical protein
MTDNEPTNIVLEQLRVMRADISARFDRVDEDFKEIRAELKSMKATMRGFQHQTIAEIYKANLTVSAFADLDRRVSALERNSAGT